MKRVLVFSVVLASVILFASITTLNVVLGDDARYTTVKGVLVDNRWLMSAGAASADDRLYAVVGYDHPPTAADVSALSAVGLTAIPYANLPYAAVGGTRDQISAVVNLAGVQSLHANRVFQALSHDANPDPSVLFRDTNAYGTGVSSVLADRAWALGDTGQGITVAEIDTGIDASNPSVAPSPLGPVINNVQVLSDELLLYPQHDANVYLEDQVSTDNFGHGTHVAGSVVGSGLASGGFYVGVAPGAHIIGLDGLQCTLISDVLGGCLVTILSSFDWVLSNHDQYNIRVETNSWGGGAAPFDPNDPISIAVHQVVQAGIVVLFAAGNSGPAADTMSAESRNPEVIAVAAGQPSGGLVEFSSRGISGGVSPTIAAPGHLIISTRIHTGGEMDIFTAVGFDAIIPPELIPNYLVAQGTSMATPVAAGVAALVVSANPSLTPAQVKHVFESTATPMLGYQTFEVGAGFVNAEAAVRSALGFSTKANRVKLPAQMSISTDPTTNSVLLAHDYRASITGLGLVGFGHFAFSFPVYTADAKPIDIVLHWDTIQPYSVYTTGYRVTVYDPTLTEVARIDTDFFTLSQGLTFTIDAATRSSLTPAGGAYWYMDMVNFNPGWGILDMSAHVAYPAGFSPPLKTTKVPPFLLHGKTDKSAAKPGQNVQSQGTVEDADGNALDGVPVQIELVGPLGVSVWQGATTSVDGSFTAAVPVPASAADGSYAVRFTAGDVTTSTPLTVDSAPPVLTGASVSPAGANAVRIQATATDAVGLAYVRAVLSNPSTESTFAMFLAPQSDGTFAAVVGLPSTGTWSVAITSVDRAVNFVSIDLSIPVG